MDAIKYIKTEALLSHDQNTTFADLAKQVAAHYTSPIAAAFTDKQLKELGSKVSDECKAVDFIDLSHKDGMRIYQRTATFVMIVAVRKLFPEATVVVNHHITGGYFCELSRDIVCDVATVKRIQEEMRRLVDAALPIEKSTLALDEALRLFAAQNMKDKTALLKYRRTSTINVYQLDGVSNYFYGYMMPNTEAVKLFDLIPYGHGFVLLFPDEKKPTQLAPFLPPTKLSGVFTESKKWARILEVDTVAALNDVISHGKLEHLIRISEALHEKKIAAIADRIEENQEVKVVLIAGPSSSGKTTFAERLCIQLRVNGMRPHALSIDDYFVERENTPLDEDGKYDFEALEAIDTELFNEHVSKLIAGETVEIPTFNFKTGKREYKGKYVKLAANEILVIEGIHGLNEKLSHKIPKANKFKVYVSCLTQLNIDNHNRIPTTDTRLIRRMIRDHQYRGTQAEKTLEMWPSVRRGENKNIFPFQEEADAMFNTVLIYELAVLKQKAEPLLFGIERTSPYYTEAKRLLKFLEYFLPADSAQIPCNSIVREFVGGSCFH